MHRLPEQAIEYFAENDYTVDERREHAARGFQLRYQFHHENAETRERVERILTRARKTRAAEAVQQRVFCGFVIAQLLNGTQNLDRDTRREE